MSWVWVCLLIYCEICDCEKVHITQGDHVGKGVIVSWVTVDEPGSNTVIYWAENTTLKKQSDDGIVLTYKYFNYTSGYIHHTTITDLEVCICC